ncbi:alpha-galactosidase [Bifidobacterium callitrichos]|uniref:alpha-galactosidase n=2 Tax=Bifidobacterium callitrichos TaxID=762209 RepID=A0A087A4X7_9BIFI|nr:alpha-galactosidase [Bifidobacterium callitrichos]KFI53827.1 glycoside hydrolase clan GH-D [Bifidobacterium callitrichos DSM 23973]
MLFPESINSNQSATRMAFTDAHVGDPLPAVIAVFPAADTDGIDPIAPNPKSASKQVAEPSLRLSSLLNEPSHGSCARPALRGYRIMSQTADVTDGVDWSTRFTLIDDPAVENGVLVFTAEDRSAGLQLQTTVEPLIGGSLRIRHRLTNICPGTYVIEGLEVRIPLSDNQTEFMDFTGRHENERQPQRHTVADGTWTKEGRRGKPSYEGCALIAGTPGFGFGSGSVISVQPAWSGNSVLAVDRTCEDGTAIYAGEQLLPGEIMLGQGDSYETPWVVVSTSDQGLDGIAQSLHTWQRGLASHPDMQPVTLNVWEAVYMDHDFDTLAEIARRAAAIGVERYVLDDGWFHLRRDDHAGLGDWWVDPTVWPNGLRPLTELVHGLGMQFGLWFEPEMINQDSDLYRAHPDWVMQASDRLPLPFRNQYVLDLTNPHAYAHVLEAISTVLTANPVDYVKWDHNRDLNEAGSNTRGGAAAVHRQTQAYYRLLDELRERFPSIQWESCASGGGRIDLGVIEHVSRVWTSDMTDALSRQRIQRWTVQNIAPEYMGAHVSAPTSHQSGRTYSLPFRAATAVFYGFGIEWNIMQASEGDLSQLAAWIAWFKANRTLLHNGIVRRLDIPDPSVYAYGVSERDGRRAVIAHVQVDESSSNRGVWLRVPGLEPSAEYRLRWSGPRPVDGAALEEFNPNGPIGDSTITGRTLERIGFWMPRCRPETMRIIEIVQV